jgi:ribosomal protein S12 methylthiotransferase accessory factor
VLRAVEIDVHVPESFPARYREAVVRAASNCAVKKAIAAQPEFRITVTSPAARAAG